MDPRIGNIPAGMDPATEIIAPWTPRGPAPMGDSLPEFSKLLEKAHGSPQSTLTKATRESFDDSELRGLTGEARVTALIKAAHAKNGGAWQPGVVDADNQAIIKASRANLGHDEHV